jgi:hypothetical protein
MPYQGDGKQISIRFPKGTYETVSRMAKEDHRSISAEVVYLVEQSIKRSSESHLHAADSSPDYSLDDKDRKDIV